MKIANVSVSEYFSLAIYQREVKIYRKLKMIKCVLKMCLLYLFQSLN